MSEFRVYVIGWDGHILRRIELDQCSDESEAREKAKQLVVSHDVELWERTRLIERFRRSDSDDGPACTSAFGESSPKTGPVPCLTGAPMRTHPWRGAWRVTPDSSP